MEAQGLKSIIEALLFVSDKPLTIAEMGQVLSEADGVAIAAALEELVADYEARDAGLRLVRVAGGYQITSAPQAAPWIRRLHAYRERRRLSRPALETLAIIAYKQPITRAEVEAIRGVDVSGILQSLLEKALICMKGRKKVAGRPIMYGTTPEFLCHFGLDDLASLPKLAELAQIVGEQEPPPSVPAQEGEHAENKEETN